MDLIVTGKVSEVALKFCPIFVAVATSELALFHADSIVEELTSGGASLDPIRYAASVVVELPGVLGLLGDEDFEHDDTTTRIEHKSNERYIVSIQ